MGDPVTLLEALALTGAALLALAVAIAVALFAAEAFSSGGLIGHAFGILYGCMSALLLAIAALAAFQAWVPL
jgi:hypothetical protein